MNLDRSLIKSQAKQLIKNKVFKLFIISLIVMLLTGTLTTVINISTTADQQRKSGYQYGQFFKDYQNDNGDYNFFNGNNDGDDENDNPIESYGKDNPGGNSSEEGNPLDNFTGNIEATQTVVGTGTNDYIKDSIISGVVSILSIIALFLSPLAVTLSGYYVAFIRTGREIEIGNDLSSIFKNAFSATYWKKFGVYFLRDIFTFLLALCFFIPGFIYYYSTYFVEEITCDHPNLSPTEVGALSRKIIRGNRGELFILDLSFLLWYMLIPITCGLAGIYVLPYVRTTRALYYENFVMRALSEGKITPDDFLNANERALKMSNNYTQGYAQNGYNTDYRTNYNQPQPPVNGQNPQNPQGGYQSPQYQQWQNQQYNGSYQPHYQPPQYSGNGTSQQNTGYYNPNQQGQNTYNAPNAPQGNGGFTPSTPVDNTPENTFSGDSTNNQDIPNSSADESANTDNTTGTDE